VGDFVRKLLVVLAGMFLLSGCSSELSFSKVSEKGVNKNIQSFIAIVKNENGVHLYFDNQKAIYVYLNGRNVKQGEKAIYFTDFDVKEEGDTLNILYSNAVTTDYTNQSLKHELLYKVTLNKKYEYVKPFSNGNEVSFGVVSGKQ
jgi:beta-lactamase superfamily II metal-dependent hydrolase